MRVAVLIIGLIGFVLAGLQSCAVAVGGSAVGALSATAADRAEAEDVTAAGGLGVLAALIWVVGSAFVLGKPRVAVVAFGVAALFWLGAGALGFSDGYIWAGVSVILTVLSVFGVREKRRKGEPVEV